MLHGDFTSLGAIGNFGVESDGNRFGVIGIRTPICDHACNLLVAIPSSGHDDVCIRSVIVNTSGSGSCQDGRNRIVGGGNVVQAITKFCRTAFQSDHRDVFDCIVRESGCCIGPDGSFSLENGNRWISL